MAFIKKAISALVGVIVIGSCGKGGNVTLPDPTPTAYVETWCTGDPTDATATGWEGRVRAPLDAPESRRIAFFLDDQFQSEDAVTARNEGAGELRYDGAKSTLIVDTSAADAGGKYFAVFTYDGQTRNVVCRRDLD